MCPQCLTLSSQTILTPNPRCQAIRACAASWCASNRLSGKSSVLICKTIPGNLHAAGGREARITAVHDAADEVVGGERQNGVVGCLLQNADGPDRRIRLGGEE